MGERHAETAPDAVGLSLRHYACALVQATGTVRFFPALHIATAYGTGEASEGYRCRYGLNTSISSSVHLAPFSTTTTDAPAGEVRAVELDEHPFFVAALFQPERAALKGQLPPLVATFVHACASNAAQQTLAGDRR